MMAEQIVLPFRLMRKSRRVKGRTLNDDLVGSSYFDGVSETVVTGVCPANPEHVLVERESDGKRWTVPAGLIRLIVRHKKRRRTA
jgi:hypothetical protein